MDFSLLPTEIFTEIVLYLNVEDLLSCCLVNSTWRNLINQNKVWFRLCARRHFSPNEALKYFEEVCSVEPYFSHPQNDCDSLSDLCKWRKTYMQEAHLTRNWRSGRCSSEYITTTESLTNAECDDTVVVVNLTQRREFVVYSIKDAPREIEIVSFSLRHVASDFFKLYKNKLVVLQCTLLQVFEKTPENGFRLRFRALFNQNENETHSMPITGDITEWYRNNIGLYPSDLSTACDHNGNHFVGVILEGDLNRAVFHIWDIYRHEKSDERFIQEINEQVLDINFSLIDTKLYMVIKVLGEYGQHTILNCFSLENFDFTNLLIVYVYAVPAILFCNKFVVNLDTTGKCLYIWDNDTGQLIKEINCDYYINPMTIQFYHHSVCLSGINSSLKGLYNVEIFNTQTMTLSSKLKLNYKVIDLLYVRPDLILTCGWNKFDLWDAKSSSLINTLKYSSWTWTNPVNSKLVVELDDDLYLLRFW